MLVYDKLSDFKRCFFALKVDFSKFVSQFITHIVFCEQVSYMPGIIFLVLE